MLLFVLVFSVNAENTKAQNTLLTIKRSNVPLEQVIDDIEKQSDYLFVYNKHVDVQRIVSVNIKRRSLTEVLDKLFKETDTRYAIENAYIILSAAEGKAMNASAVTQQGKPITGTVIDVNGQPVAGVNVVEKGTTNGTATGADGNFAITVTANSVLTISFIGYVTQEVAVSNRSVLKITLSEDVAALEEVVVVGYGAQKKVNLSGAVSTISAKALENRVVTNANQVLQGLAANMNITQTSGIQTSAPEINVRGYTSINGGSAFILVDNVPVSPEELSRINPADIESATVLKDAASAAIYGARAAFGVVLITTKSVKSEQLQVTGDFNYGVRQYSKIYSPDLDIVNFFEVTNQAQLNPSRHPEEQIEYARRRMADPSLAETIFPGIRTPSEYDYYAQTNWQKELMYDSAPTYTANVSLGRKSERLSYTMSGGYYQQNSQVLAEDPYKRYNFRGNGTYALTNWWKLGSSVSFARTDYNTSEYVGGNGAAGIFRYVATEYSIRPLNNPDGTRTESAASTVDRLLMGGRYHDVTNETQLSFNTTIDVLKDVVVVKGDATFRLLNNSMSQYGLPRYYSNTPGVIQTTGSSWATTRAKTGNYSVLNLYGDFHKTFASKHFVQALAGFNQEQLYLITNETRKDNLISGSLPSINLATGTLSTSENVEALMLRGAFGRLNYIFDNKYILELNGRYDGSSRFPKKNRFGFFPSGSVAWVLSQEKFFESVKETLALDLLKFRGSYGVLGNQVLNDYYPYTASMNTGLIGAVIDNARPMGIYQPGTVSGDLTWEKVRTINGGLDLSLLNNRIEVNFDVYTRYTEDMLTQAKPMPGVYGVGAPRTNAADLKTKGWDLSVGYRDQVSAGGSPLNYSLRFLLADSRTWITRYESDRLLGDHAAGAYLYEGMEIGEIWGFEVLGFFESDADVANSPDQTKVGSDDIQYKWYAGDVKFKDLDEDGEITFGQKTIDDPGDRRIIGNTSAHLPYSIDAYADWKGFDLRLFFQGIGKRNWYPSNAIAFWSSYTTPWTTPSTYIRDRWTPENPNGYYPRLKPYISETDNTGELNTPNTKYLQDASYVRLKNLTFGYTLPASLTDKWKIDRLRVYFSGENLFTVNHIHVDAIDPEGVGGNSYDGFVYPFQKVYSIGLTLNF
jgi:TonB-linked SusC/RagA family outer membrane protein